MANPTSSVRAVAAAAAVAIVALSGCSRGEQPQPAPSTPGSTVPSTPGGDAPSGAPPAPPSSPYTWPSPTTRAINPGGQPRGTSITAAATDRTSADAVARAFLVLSFTPDSRTDRTPADASRRAIPLAAPQVASSLTSTAGSATDAQWSALVQAGGYRTATLSPNRDDGRPDDDATHALRSFLVTTSDHPGGATTTQVIYLSLTKQGTTWSVSGVQGS